MNLRIKRSLKLLVPATANVPVKYWSDRIRRYAEPEMSLLRHLFRTGDRVVDVGGNRGVYSYYCWRLGARVEIFEPNPTCVAFLEPWVSKHAGVNLHRIGLSDKLGSAELHIPIDTAGVEHDASASLEKHNFGKQRAQLISLAPLDDFFLQDVSFIKIDVEGHESSVLRGASKTLMSSRPAMLVEVEQRHLSTPIEDVFRLIERYGYMGFFLQNGQLKALVEFNLSRHQGLEGPNGVRGAYINNFLFLHGSRLKSGEYKTLPGLTRSR